MPHTGKQKYDIRYYAEYLSLDMPPRRAILHSRTLNGSKEEAGHRFPPHAPGDTIRIYGVVCSGAYSKNCAVVVSENVFPRSDWVESDEARWFRMTEDEAELADETAPSGEEPPVPHAKIKYIAETLGIQPYRVAALLFDYGDVISEISVISLITFADAARYLDVKKCRIEQWQMKGRLGDVVRFPKRCFLRRKNVEAFAEKRRQTLEEFWERVRQLAAEDRHRRRRK